MCLALSRCDFQVELTLKVNGEVILHFLKAFALGFLMMVNSPGATRNNFILHNYSPYSVKKGVTWGRVSGGQRRNLQTSDERVFLGIFKANPIWRQGPCKSVRSLPGFLN